jgi:PHS family inorganic phosphate transporter-like MFS transporter
LSATIMSEYANTKTRGAFVAAVFAMQGIGILAAGSVGIISSAIFNHIHHVPTFAVDPIGSTPRQADFLWRFIFVLGAFPALATYYYRMKMPETARYTALIEGNTKQAAADMTKVLHVTIEADTSRHVEPALQYKLFSAEFFRRHGRHLLGTTTCWFFLDIGNFPPQSGNSCLCLGAIPGAILT